jgi:NADH dehydrogenase
LLDGGHQVVVLGRNPAKVASIPELAGAEGKKGDVTDPSTLPEALGGAEAIVGAVQFPNYPMELPRKGLTFDRYDRAGTEHLLEAAERAGVKRYVYISGAGADPASDRSWYRAKGLAEHAIAASPLEHAIVRPSWAYGPGDRAVNRLALAARLGPLVPQIGLRPQRIQPVYVKDLASAIVRIFERQDAWGRTFEVGSSEVMTMRQVIDTMLEVMGRRRLVLPLPVPLMKVLTAPMVMLPKPLLTPTGVDFAVQDGLVDTTALIKVLDVHPRPLRDGLSEYLAP